MQRGKYIRTKKTRMKQSDSMQGKTNHLGKKHSKKTKEKLSKLALKAGRMGNKNPHWRGGKVIIEGYVYIHNPKHPLCTKLGYVAEHRLIVEKNIGRYLLRKEVVHHINEDTLDNRIKNLELFASNGIHSVENHLKRNKYGRFKKN